MAVRRLRSRQLGLFVRGGLSASAPSHSGRSTVSCGAEPRHCCRGLPAVPSASLAGGTGDAERGCADRAPGICGSSASVTPVGPQLIPSLQLPNPFGFVVGFYSFIYLPFLSSRTRAVQSVVPHTQLLPLHRGTPWYPQLCTATSWAVPSS